MHSGEGDRVCFTEADNNALSLAISELPKVLMLITAALIPYLNLNALTPDISFEGIMIENGWNVLHYELIGSVALQKVGFAHPGVSDDNNVQGFQVLRPRSRLIILTIIVHVCIFNLIID